MRILRYDAGQGSALGIMIDATKFVPVTRINSDLPSDLIDLMMVPSWQAQLDGAEAHIDDAISMDEVSVLPFLEKPHSLWALALNFKTHIKETGLTTSHEHAHLFLRVAESYIGHQQDILSPPAEIGRAFDYEGELGVIIGRAGRHIPVDKALDHVAGYTAVNEGSVREYQHHNRQFGLGKNFGASGSYGPWMMTPDEFGDPASHRLITRINGVERQNAPLDDMLFSVAQVVSYLSEAYTLQCGDFIAMGTPGALAPKPGDEAGLDFDNQFGTFKVPGLVHMRPGDVVEIEIDGFGVLSNPVVADQPATYRQS